MSDSTRIKAPQCTLDSPNGAVAGPEGNPLAMHGMYGNSFLQASMREGVDPSASLLAPGLLGLLGCGGGTVEDGVEEDPVGLGTCEQEEEIGEVDTRFSGLSERIDSRPTGGGVQLLVGGAFTDKDGVEQPYGHVSLRVFDGTGERDVVYDFGRYGETNGQFSAEGEGILREWDHSFEEYLALQNGKGRGTTGYTFPATPEQVAEAFEMFDNQIAEAELQSARQRGDGERRIHKLPENYHGVHNNCTTLSVDGFEAARPDIDLDVAEENQGRGMSQAEKLAAQTITGWPDEVFMPADLGAVLQGAATEEVLVERWDPERGVPHEVLRDPGMTCVDPAVLP